MSKISNQSYKPLCNYWNGHYFPQIETYSNSLVKPEMCFFCFDVLVSYLYNSISPERPAFSNESVQFFVSWQSDKDKKLCGCLGTFTAMNLHEGLREYAISSAVGDARFTPITKDMLPQLICSISILHHFEEARHCLDWEIGKHGLRIDFDNEKGHRKTATYLPEIPNEQGWDQVQTIDSLLRKGGWKTEITDSVRRAVSVTRYQTEKASLSYAEYMTIKNKGGTKPVSGLNGFRIL